MTERRDFYSEPGCGYYSRFIKLNPEFDTYEFQEYVFANNRFEQNASRFNDIAQHEVLRLAWGFAEFKWRNTKNNTEYRYGFYQDPGCNYFFGFMDRNPEFNVASFGVYCDSHNRGLLDGAQQCDFPRHDVLRMAYGYAEEKFRNNEGVTV